MPSCSQKLCLIDSCQVCTSELAICTSSSSHLPTALEDSLIDLSVSYQPLSLSGVIIDSEVFSKFTRLQHLSLSGRVAAIENGSFDTLTHLTHLQIWDTDLTSLPEPLLFYNHRLETLSLQRNRFTMIPADIFGGGVAAVKDYYFIDNKVKVSLPCLKGAPVLPPAFRLFPRLMSLHLVGVRLQNSTCSKATTADTFAPIANRNRSINLTNSEFFLGSFDIFDKFTRLQSISIGNVEPYKRCPADAAPLLLRLPRSLQYLELARWESNAAMDPGCVFSEETMKGIQQLPHFKFLSFNSSDLLFGHYLRKGIFKNMTNLAYLDLHYCRISSIEEGAFSDLISLKTLILSGNPLGIRYVFFWDALDKILIRNLYIKDLSLRTDEFLQFGHKNLRTVKFLAISQNRLQYLPFFSKDVVVDSNMNTPLRVQSLIMSDNIVQELVPDWCGCNKSDILRTILPRIDVLHLEDNDLRSLEGLDGLKGSLNYLWLNRNSLNINLDSNMHILEQMERLRSLDMSSNKFRSISHTLLRRMSYLKYFILSHNEISTLPSDMFSNNLKMRKIDLRDNELTSVDADLFRHLTDLTEINLSDNSIFTLDSSFTDFVDSSAVLARVHIAGNHLDCGCSRLFFQDWIKSTERVVYVRVLKCRSSGELVHNYTEDYFKCRVELPLTIFGATAAAVLLALLLGIPCYKYRWYISHLRVVYRAVSEQLKKVSSEEEFEYDAYLSYNSKSEDDSQWIIDKLIPSLEECDKRDMVSRTKA